MKKIFIFLLLISSGFAQNPSNEDMYKQFQQMKQKILDNLLNDSQGLMDDLDENLFKSFGYGANLSSDMFLSRWQEDKEGKVFLITPQKNADLNIEVNKGFITIKATQKTGQSQSSSEVSMNVPQDLDWQKHKISKKGEDIAIFFPYVPGMAPKNMKSLEPVKNKKEKHDDEMVPIVPQDGYDVI